MKTNHFKILREAARARSTGKRKMRDSMSKYTVQTVQTVQTSMITDNIKGKFIEFFENSQFEMFSLENVERQEKSSLGKECGKEEEQRLFLFGKDLLLLLLDLAGGLHLEENGVRMNKENFLTWQSIRLFTIDIYHIHIKTDEWLLN